MREPQGGAGFSLQRRLQPPLRPGLKPRLQAKARSTTTCVLGIVLAILTAHAEVLDRIAVTVGKQVISESEIIRDLRVAAFLDAKPVDLSVAAKRESADRLVEQILIQQEATDSHISLAVDADLARLLAQVKQPYATPADYDAALARYGVQESDVVIHLTVGLRMLQFMNLRFRPAVQIQDQDLRAYYDKFAEQARSANPAKPVPSFEDSRDQIETILTEQRVEQALDAWLAMERSEVPIVYRSQVVP